MKSAIVPLCCKTQFIPLSVDLMIFPLLPAAQPVFTEMK
jgi:hypothetical protein